MKPNIFDIATKELHQDAFITWLIQWGNNENERFDRNLFLCGQEFISLLIKNQYNVDVMTIDKVEAGRQWKGIDVWAEVYTHECNYLIIIEDKTFTSEHSEQLLKYKQTGEEFCTENNFKLVCIYLKTGSEPEKDLKAIRAKGFATFSRSDFLKLLLNYAQVTNDIFFDFKNRLERIESEHTAFGITEIGKWNDACWIGFYQFLENEIGINTWHYVNPPGGGGFWNASLNWEDWDGFPVYLQIEQGDLCFKIATHPQEIYYEGDFNRGEKRNQWHNILISQATKVGLPEIKKPQRFGSGDYMTAAIVSRNIWLGKDEEVIDRLLVTERLRKYKQFLKDCL
ncbi:MAG TPA: PD-(D/E)XK nuclease family protein [Chitinophagaceae bacterium]